MEGEFNLGEFKPTDFSNPMYDALDGSESKSGGSTSGMYEVPQELVEKSRLGGKEVPFEKPTMASAVLSPSSVTHKSSPQVRKTALDPTSIETDKDTQNLVEEDNLET